MSNFNPNLIYYLERLQGFSTNIFRLESQNKTTAKSNDIITFDLPSNAILNLRSLKVWCNATADASAVASGARLPPINDLIERCEISVGGVVLSQGTNFINVLNEAKRSLGVIEYDSVTGHSEYLRKKSYVDGFGSAGAAVLTTNMNESYPATEPQKFCIDHFEGFLASAEPKLLDTSLIPDIRVRLYMASDNVLTTSVGTGIGGAVAAVGFEAGIGLAGGVAGGTYELTNIMGTIEAIGLADQNYDNMISAMLSQQGFLEVPYKSYTSFQETHSGSSRFTVSSSSLDRVYVTWRATNYNNQSAPIILNGYKTQGGYIMGTVAAGNATVDLGLPQYDVGGVLGTNSEKYKSKYFNFVAPTMGTKMQLQLNGAYYPQFSANLGQTYGITVNSVPGNRQKKDMSFDQYRHNHCVQCYRLNLPDSEYSRLLSGLDTRAVNLQGIVRTEGATPSLALAINIFAETTEVLRIGAGRAIEIIA